MKFILFNELSPSRQKALQAINGWRVRAEHQMNDAQMEHGTQSSQFAVASHRFECALGCYNDQVARTQMPDHPLYVSQESSDTYHKALAILECPHCHTPLGINPQDGQMDCPHLLCCAI